MNSYQLVSHWHFAAPFECIWDGLYAVEAWPKWWKYAITVGELERGDDSGVGAVRRYTWGSRLPYRLSFSMRTTVVDPPQLLEGIAQGELNGLGRWTLAQEGVNTHVRYDWQVATSRAWMNALAPVLAPMFRWNHGEVMAEGARGLFGSWGYARWDPRVPSRTRSGPGTRSSRLGAIPGLTPRLQGSARCHTEDV